MSGSKKKALHKGLFGGRDKQIPVEILQTCYLRYQKHLCPKCSELTVKGLCLIH